MKDETRKKWLFGLQAAGAGIGIVGGILAIKETVSNMRNGRKMLESDKRQLAALIAAEMAEREEAKKKSN